MLNFLILISDNHVSTLKKCILKSLGVKGHDVSSFLSNGQERERDKEWEKYMNNSYNLGKGFMKIPCPTHSYSFSVYLKLDRNGKF